ncbi:xylulokinase [Candidatus Bathyarchaeota archaeon]|nr:xylulokinase [Candidatus Bathyarchaeota archaeon]
MPSFLMGIDLGTSSCKTVIFDLDGKKVSEAQEEYPVYHPQPRWAEQKPQEWWNAAVRTIRESLKKARIQDEEIVGLSVTSQREAVVPIDKKGEELYNSIIWLDARTVSQVRKIRELLSEQRVLSITGVAVNPIYTASKILWLKENVSEVYEKTACFLCAKDYIVYKLTGETVTDYSMASRTMLFDVVNRKWSTEICSALDITTDKLPPVKESTSVIGEVSAKASQETNLPKEIQVVNGGGDRPCECLGAGVTQPGSVNIGTGTGSVVEVPLSKPVIDAKGRIPCCCHVIPNTWEYEAIIATTGASLRWFRDTFCSEEKSQAQKQGLDPYDLLTEKAEKTAPGADGLFYYPYLTGAFSPKFNEKARGIFFGISISHGKGHFVRAILEGVAFQYLDTFKLLRTLGVKIHELHMVGGETRSSLWNQIKADVLGNEIQIPEVDDAAALGAALLAGTGVKQYQSLKKAVEKAVKTKKIFKPNPERQKAYTMIYKNYKTIYSKAEKGFMIY